MVVVVHIFTVSAWPVTHSFSETSPLGPFYAPPQPGASEAILGANAWSGYLTQDHRFPLCVLFRWSSSQQASAGSWNQRLVG